MAKISRIVKVVIIFLGFTSIVEAASVTLIWRPVRTNADGSVCRDLGGYRLYGSEESFKIGEVWKSTAEAMVDPNIWKIDISSNTNETQREGLEYEKVYYFRLTAYDIGGNQSKFNVDSDGIDNQVAVKLTESDYPPSSPVNLRVKSIGAGINIILDNSE